MAYTCEISSGQRLYLENSGEQTAVTLASSSTGQQQQSSSQFTTGAWTAPPEAFQTAAGVVIKLTTTQGVQHLQVQGNQMGLVTDHPVPGSAQQMQMSTNVAMPSNTMPPMESMPPMQPMRMGDMEMSLNPMQMRMGNMEMQMGKSVKRSPGKTNFCSQCGTPVKPSDRFCANCGHQLQD
ncbi:zinc ribbon domain-containing protein [Oscillatoria sp. CS-180]|nr:zinc ribbon domain-containing protein [Oscillatoria sp. CS-180]